MRTTEKNHDEIIAIIHIVNTEGKNENNRNKIMSITVLLARKES